MSAPAPAETPKRKLRWYQFSLRTLLVFVTLFGIACSWFAVKMKQATKQREAVQAIIQSGGRVIYNFEVEFIPESERDMNDDDLASMPSGSMFAIYSPPPPPLGPEWLRNWLGTDFLSHVISVSVDNDASLEPLKYFPHLQELNIGYEMLSMAPGPEGMRKLDSSVIDPKWKILRQLPQLQELSLSASGILDAELDFLQDASQLELLNLGYTPITGKGLIYLRNLKKLKILTLSDCDQLTDEGLVSLIELRTLKVLELNNTGITDSGLKNLKELSQLRVLSLAGTPITDDGMKCLEGLTALRDLNLQGTQITDDGIKRLKNLKNLRGLYLQTQLEAKYSDNVVEHLGAFTQLRGLSLICSDAALPRLKPLKKLRYLTACSNRITDNGLEALKSLDQLKELYLYDTKISQASFDELQKARPNMKINHN
jgi:internalin A